MNRKVMLIMDEPLDCTDCPLTDLSSMTGDKLCLASNKRWIETQNEYKKPDWCPLKPLPDDVTKEETGAYVKGFLDALISEVDDESNTSD